MRLHKKLEICIRNAQDYLDYRSLIVDAGGSFIMGQPSLIIYNNSPNKVKVHIRGIEILPPPPEPAKEYTERTRTNTMERILRKLEEMEE